MNYIKNSLIQSHMLIAGMLKKGDTAIDATAGNGHDTVFLAKLVGPEGKVYSFDIQDEALYNTKRRIEEENLTGIVTLIKDGHENMDIYIKEEISAVMFNLGYLPGGDHSIATKGETTIKALNASMKLLRPGGIITVVVYYGKDSGFDEKNAVLDFVKTIDPKSFTVMKTEFVNQKNCPPILICIEKLNRT